MNPDSVRILVIQVDSEGDAALNRALEGIREPRVLTRVEISHAAGAARVAQGGFDAVILDLGEAPANPLDAVRRILVAARETPVIVLGPGDVEVTAREFLQEGAHDWLLRDTVDPAVLERAIRFAAERKRVTQTLHDSEERYRKFFRDDLTADFITSPTGRVIDCNPAFVKLFGFDSYEHALQANTKEIYPNPESRAKLMQILREKRRLEGVELDLCRVDGTPLRVIENIIGNFNDHGELVTLQGYIFDITERVQLELQLRHVQKMEAMGQLAGGVAHDFNNLLTVILGQAQLLTRQLEHDAPARRGLAEIAAAAERAAALTRQLLAFSRKQVLERRPLDLNEIIEGMVRMLERLIGESVKLEKDCANGLWLVSADAGQIEQVVMNLVVNARDAMPEGGRVTLRTANVVTDRGEWIEIGVRDTGTGIEPKHLARIFEPFFTTKAAGRGTGLGLAMVYGIVEQSGGSIEVQSAPWEGTEIVIRLPRVEGARAAAAKTETADTGRGSETLLLVEDEDAVRQMVREALEGCGYTVIEAADGNEAIGMLGAHPEVQLLLTDVVMPGMAGPSIVEAARRQRPALRVLYMSGYSENLDIAEGLGVGLIAKPFTPDALNRKIRDIIEAA
jgi:PAS domain S-box-containing protein